jgi:polyphosphate glucokinase
MGARGKSTDRILAIDIGGTGLKAALIDRRGRMLTDRLRVKTPHPSPPRVLVRALGVLVRPLALDSSVIGVSVGFPGVVRHGKVVTAPNLGTAEWRGFDLATALSKLWKKPVRVKNDADLQGLGASRGKGVEVVITLGTGFGSAILVDGWLGPHLEISQHAFRKGETYDQQLGNAARERIGKKKWNRRVERAIEGLRTLTNFDALYIGGGNGRHVRFELPADVRLVENDCGMKGGAALWRSGLESPRAR